MLQLKEKHHKIVLDILKPVLDTHRVYAFGSRAKNTAEKFSDLDIFIDGNKIAFEKISQIKGVFSDSDLPFFVDLLQKCNLDQKMYDNIKNDFVASICFLTV